MLKVWLERVDDKYATKMGSLPKLGGAGDGEAWHRSKGKRKSAIESVSVADFLWICILKHLNIGI
jgi:hypothetical protein